MNINEIKDERELVKSLKILFEEKRPTSFKKYLSILIWPQKSFVIFGGNGGEVKFLPDWKWI